MTSNSEYEDSNVIKADYVDASIRVEIPPEATLSCKTTGDVEISAGVATAPHTECVNILPVSTLRVGAPSHSPPLAQASVSHSFSKDDEDGSKAVDVSAETPPGINTTSREYRTAVDSLWAPLQGGVAPIPPSVSTSQKGSTSMLMIAAGVPLPKSSPKTSVKAVEDCESGNNISICNQGEQHSSLTPTPIHPPSLAGGLSPNNRHYDRMNSGTSESTMSTPSPLPCHNAPGFEKDDRSGPSIAGCHLSPTDTLGGKGYGSTSVSPQSYVLRAAGDPLSPAHLAISSGTDEKRTSLSPRKMTSEVTSGQLRSSLVSTASPDEKDTTTNTIPSSNLSSNLSIPQPQDIPPPNIPCFPPPPLLNPFEATVPPTLYNNPFSNPTFASWDQSHRRAGSVDSPLASTHNSPIKHFTSGVEENSPVGSSFRVHNESHFTSGTSYPILPPQDGVALGVLALEEQEKRRELDLELSRKCTTEHREKHPSSVNNNRKRSKRSFSEGMMPTSQATTGCNVAAAPQSSHEVLQRNQDVPQENMEISEQQSQPVAKRNSGSRGSLVGMFTPFRKRRSSSVQNMEKAGGENYYYHKKDSSESVKKLKYRHEDHSFHDHISSKTSKIVYGRKINEPNWDIFRKESYDDKSNPLLCGYLSKKNKNASWQRRYFETYGDYLTYYHNKKRKKVLAMLDLCKVGNIAQDPSDDTSTTFFIEIAKRPYYLRADSEAICKDWVINLNRLREARVELGRMKLVTDIPSLDRRQDNGQNPRSNQAAQIHTETNRGRSHALRDVELKDMYEGTLEISSASISIPQKENFDPQRSVGSTITPPATLAHSANLSGAIPSSKQVPLSNYQFHIGSVESSAASHAGRNFARWQKRRSRLSKIRDKIKRWATSIVRFRTIVSYRRDHVAVEGLRPVLEYGHEGDLGGSSSQTVTGSDLTEAQVITVGLPETEPDVANQGETASASSDVQFPPKQKILYGDENIVGAMEKLKMNSSDGPDHPLSMISGAGNSSKSSLWSIPSNKKLPKTQNEELLNYEDSELNATATTRMLS